MTTATLGRWGNNLAVRLPGDIVRAARLKDGERVEIIADADAILIRRVAPVTLENLFRGMSAEAWRSAYAGAYDWDADRGREVISE